MSEGVTRSDGSLQWITCQCEPLREFKNHMQADSSKGPVGHVKAFISVAGDHGDRVFSPMTRGNNQISRYWVANLEIYIMLVILI
jgi:hypothetical protein